MEHILIRSFQEGDEDAVAGVVRETLQISNSRDYPEEFIRENIESHSAEVIRARARESHFYVACDGGTVIGCGGITGYWGSTEVGSSLTAVHFYEKMGYECKDGSMDADEYGVVRLEKRKEK